MTVAHPLQWPAGWPRTPDAERNHGSNKFKRQVDNGRYRESRAWTFAAARDALLEEIGRHGAVTCVISTNFALDRRFLAVEGKRRPDDEGVAIYFQRNGKPIVMACDRFHDAEGNMRSLTLALEALRQLERHGGGIMLERAYEGFAALPGPDTGPRVRPWRAVFDLDPAFPWQLPADEAVSLVQARYRKAAKDLHADAGGDDAGGDDAAMSELNTARDAAMKELGT